MFCPQCGSNQSNELKFCRTCGANLQSIRQAVIKGEPDEKFDWSKTWVADMFLSERELKRREEEFERLRGITPEIKRFNEIKAGVITSCVGLGTMIFLFFLMQGIILSGEVNAGEAEILSRIWIAGVIPFLIGIGLMINGSFVSKKFLEIADSKLPRETNDLTEAPQQPFALKSDAASEFANFSVTEQTTRHLTNRSSNNKL